MDIQGVLKELDNLFANKQIMQVEPFLQKQIHIATEEADVESLITLLNESIGFYRDTSQYDKSMSCCSEVKDLMENLGLQGTVPYATTLLNIANAARAAGRFEESLSCYAQVFDIYDHHLETVDFRYASLYNNLSLLYQEMEDFERAAQALERALEIIVLYPEARIELATTHTNLAASLLRIERWKDAEEHLQVALHIFEQDEEKDYHYSAALSVMGELAFQKGEYEKAADYIKHAMDELESHVGKTESYWRLSDNLEVVQKKLQVQQNAQTKKNDDPIPKEQMTEEQLMEALIENGISEEALAKLLSDEQQDELQPTEEKTDVEEKAVKKAEKIEADNNVTEKVQEKQVTVQPETQTKKQDSPKKYQKVSKDQLQNVQNGMQLAKAYYEAYGKEMLSQFPMLQDKIAVGLVGEGSECFGFDDEIARDHDFGPGFCIWLSEEDEQQYGEALQRAYESMPKALCTDDESCENPLLTMQRRVMPQAGKRVGVFSINAFYGNILETNTIPFSDAFWLHVPEERLATAVNGCVFEDKLGKFSELREYILGYYPEHIWRKRLAQELALMAQCGQYNYARMLMRKEYVSAQLQLADFMKHTMKAAYLLNKVYAPHDKWLQKGMRNLHCLTEVSDMLEAIYTFSMDEKNKQLIKGENQITRMIEVIAKLFVTEIRHQKLTDVEESYLAVQAQIIAEGMESPQTGNDISKEQLIDEIVLLEWNAFDQVKNEGGRADCQDDWITFQIMRKSQYLTWTKEMLVQYRLDFLNANARGWNIITEKYARMMESTAKEEYALLKEQLPSINNDKKMIMEQIIQIQIGWMEEFAREYPYMAGNARNIHTSEDTPYQTSYETYLRGEIGTYSDAMLELYGRFIAAKAKQHVNLAKEIMTNTAMLYGYESLDDAEISAKKEA